MRSPDKIPRADFEKRRRGRRGRKEGVGQVSGWPTQWREGRGPPYMMSAQKEGGVTRLKFVDKPVPQTHIHTNVKESYLNPQLKGRGLKMSGIFCVF